MTTPHWKPRHHPGCTRPRPVHTTTRDGQHRATCPGCGKFWHPRPRPVEPVVYLEPDPEPEPTGRYRCRVHHDREVSWRGVGCTDCAAERDPARRTRRRITETPGESPESAARRLVREGLATFGILDYRPARREAAA